ncbi:MAG: UDP-N-acetylmuramate dehydrogenase [Anaerovoracaceae bacterium]
MDINMIKNMLIAELGRDSVRENAAMDRYTSFRAGGCADVMIEPSDTEELKTVLRILDSENCPHIILGNGSNILVKDSGYRGVVIKIGAAFDYFRTDEEDETVIKCGAGSLMAAVAKNAAQNNLSGLEFASGIPGSIGGAVFMNAGAYGGEISQVLESVFLVSKDGKRDFYMNGADMELGYRHSLIQKTGDIVVGAKFRLKHGNREDIKKQMTELNARRNEKQPVNYPSAGSFFKRPEGYFAGKLIQDAGLKGTCVGGAEVSQLHSGFIINKGGATASDILQLMEIVQATVFEKFGVKLEPEVRIIG